MIEIINFSQNFSRKNKEINNNFCTNIETKIGDYILSLVDDKVEVEKPTIQPEPVVEDNNSGYKYRTETF